MERKINGKSVTQVIGELSTPFTNYAEDFNNHANIPYEIIRKKATDILGLNFSTDVDITHLLIENEQVVVCKATVSIFDDAGVLVASRSHTRSDGLTRYSEKRGALAGKISLENDDFSSTTSLALKKAFTLFGLGAQFSEAKGESAMIHGVQKVVEETKLKSSYFKGVVTLIAAANSNKTFIFQSADGKPVELSVDNPNKVENFQKLIKLAPGSSIEIRFNADNMHLLGVA